MDNHNYDIIIIGAGAAGLAAAASASAGNSRVAVLEKMPRPARKVMITGKGRCNFTNMKSWSDFSEHLHPKAAFAKHSFYALTPENLVELFKEKGLESVVERGDRVFPSSGKACDVVDTLVRAASSADLFCSKEVDGIQRENDVFVLTCKDGSRWTCTRLIVTTGGLSYPLTGSTGDGYRWASALGHTVRPQLPSLTAIVPKGYKDGSGHISRETPLSEYGRMLNGISLKNISLTLMIDGNPAQDEFGDIDFTDGGLEGPIGFKISRRCVSAISSGSKVGIIIDLKPAVSAESLQSRISALFDEISKNPKFRNRHYRDRLLVLLGRLMPSALVKPFLADFPGTDHKRLSRDLKNWRMDIAGYVGYERCVVTNGGVSLEEVNSKTLESKLVPGLYFAGEVLDMDADTGGYNLHFAFSSGHLAGLSAAKSLK